MRWVTSEAPGSCSGARPQQGKQLSSPGMRTITGNPLRRREALMEIRRSAFIQPRYTTFPQKPAAHPEAKVECRMQNVERLPKGTNKPLQSRPKARHKPVASQVLARCARILFVFSSYSLLVLLLFCRHCSGVPAPPAQHRCYGSVFFGQGCDSNVPTGWDALGGVRVTRQARFVNYSLSPGRNHPGCGVLDGA